jgi:hypothetical protein
MAHPTSGFYTRNGFEYVSQSTVTGETDPVFDPEKIKALEFWRNKCEAEGEDWEAIIQDSCERGTLLHYKIESKLGFPTEAPPEMTPARRKHLLIGDYVSQMREFINMLHTVRSMGDSSKIRVEQEKFSDDFGFACTSDMTLHIGFTKKGWDYCVSDLGPDAPYTILDWKNVRPPDLEKLAEQGKKPKAKSRSEHASNFIQLGANALAHNEMVKRGEIDEPLITQGVICAMYSWRSPRFHILNLEQLTEQVMLFVERLAYYQSIYGKMPRPVKAG